MDSIYRTIRVGLPEEADQFPPDFGVELLRTKVLNYYDHRTISIPSEKVQRLLSEITSNLHRCGLAWCSTPFWFLEIRGKKTVTRHTVLPIDATDEQVVSHGLSEDEKFRSLLDSIDWEHESMATTDWYFDVGVEIYSPNHVVQWRTSGHDEVIGKMLGCTSQRAREFKGDGTTPKFYRDVVANIPEMSGFRMLCANRTKWEGEGAVIVDALRAATYCTDKSMTYTADDMKKGTFISKSALLLGYLKTENFREKKLDKLLASLDEVYSCAEEMAPFGSARAEGRVQGIDEARNYLVNGFQQETLRRSLFLVPSSLLW
jgi:hypothetical protein